MNTIPDGLKALLDAISENSGIPYTGSHCHECKFQSRVPGSRHSQCMFFEDTATQVLAAMDIPTVPVGEKDGPKIDIPIVGVHEHGWMNGWAFWPLDFDPVWILWCLAHKPKGVE